MSQISATNWDPSSFRLCDPVQIFFLAFCSIPIFYNLQKMKLKQLKVRPKKILEASPCIAEMGALFECWATAGVDDKRCASIAKSLTLCMGKPVSYFQKLRL
jgi:hypothetical protein